MYSDATRCYRSTLEISQSLALGCITQRPEIFASLHLLLNLLSCSPLRSPLLLLNTVLAWPAESSAADVLTAEVSSVELAKAGPGASESAARPAGRASAGTIGPSLGRSFRARRLLCLRFACDTARVLLLLLLWMPSATAESASVTSVACTTMGAAAWLGRMIVLALCTPCKVGHKRETCRPCSRCWRLKLLTLRTKGYNLSRYHRCGVRLCHHQGDQSANRVPRNTAARLGWKPLTSA